MLPQFFAYKRIACKKVNGNAVGNEEDEKLQTYEITVIGSDISSMNEKISEAISSITTSINAASGILGIDIKV